MNLVIMFRENQEVRLIKNCTKISFLSSFFRGAFESRMGVAVLRNSRGGLDYSELMKRHNVGDTARLNLPDITRSAKKE